MIGFSLFAEGWGFKIPKEYLYAAIVFSVMIETFNQIASRNRVKRAAAGDLRSRTAEAVLRLLGGSRGGTPMEEVSSVLAAGDGSRRIRAGRAHHRSKSAGPGRASGEVDHDARA